MNILCFAIAIVAVLCLIGWIRQGRLVDELKVQRDEAIEHQVFLAKNEKFASDQLADARSRIEELRTHNNLAELVAKLIDEKAAYRERIDELLAEVVKLKPKPKPRKTK